jgi:endonuclease
MRPDYKKWLEDQQYDSGTIVAQLHRTGRVEKYYGDLEVLHKDGKLQAVIDELTYSVADDRLKKPNPSKIPFEGNTRNNLASYKNAVVRYKKFLSGESTQSDADFSSATGPVEASVAQLRNLSEAQAEKLSLERDMQAALRRDIKRLGSSLLVIDDGAERAVDSGFIDITCEDEVDNAIVVVELKAGRADSRAIGQILGYMGDLAQEEEGRQIRGIVVAHEFDRRAKSASRAVPGLKLVRYSVQFRFDPED